MHPLFPDRTLSRSPRPSLGHQRIEKVSGEGCEGGDHLGSLQARKRAETHDSRGREQAVETRGTARRTRRAERAAQRRRLPRRPRRHHLTGPAVGARRKEGSRGGEEWGSGCRSRGHAYNLEKKTVTKRAQRKN